jgi:hypothetical protein
MFDQNKIIQAMWCIDSNTGEEILVDLNKSEVLLRRNKEQIINPDAKETSHVDS